MMQTWYLVFVMMMPNGNIDTMVPANIEQWKNVIMEWMNICIQSQTLKIWCIIGTLFV